MSGKVLSGPAAVLIVALFFLPWITVSCDGAAAGEFSGYHLASGAAPDESADLFEMGGVNGDPILFMVPLAGIVTLILLAITLWQHDFDQNASWGQIIAAFIGLLVLALEWLQLQRESEGIFEILIQPALWGTAVALAAIGAGAVMDLMLSRQKQRQLPRMAPPPPKEKRHFVPTLIAPRKHFMPQTHDDNYTLLDEELTGTANDNNATILDEDAFAEDVFAAAPASSETILDDELLGGEYGIYTDTSRELTDLDLTRPSPPKSDDLIDTPLKNAAGNIVWAVPEESSPRKSDTSPLSSPPPDPAEPPPAPPPHARLDKTEVLHIQPEELAWLVIDSGDRRGEQIRLYMDTTIGRDLRNDIVIDDSAVSGRHAWIREENGRFFIFDQNSANGILVFDPACNRWQQKDAWELQNGSQVKLGRTVLRLVTSSFK